MKIHAILAAALVLLLAPAARADFDYKVYSEFLDSYVRTGVVIDGVTVNAVDYERLKMDTLANGSSQFPRLLARLAAFDPDTLSTREEKVAFWTNAYNIAAIKMIVDNYPVDSIRSSRISFFTIPWGKDILNVGGNTYDLETIEHSVLLDELAEPRAHFAVVCASVSCADLSPVPYRAETLDAQLEAAGRAFVNNAQKGVRIDRENGDVYVSKIFDWGEDDFRKMGGINGVLERYLEDHQDREFVKAGDYRVRYLNYNWKLNDVKFEE